MASENIKKIEEKEFQGEISSGVTLVDFYADWCGPCRMLTPVLDQVSQDVKGKATVVKVDIDQAQKVTEELQITSVPTLILFKDGKEVKRIIGLRDADFIKGFVLEATV
jgi:thioredoxin 1